VTEGGKHVRTVVIVAAWLFVAACSASAPEPPAVETRPIEVIWEGREFRAGDPVLIVSRSGTFKPSDTGHAVEVDGSAGHTGVVLRGIARTPPLRQGEPVQVLLVRWDAQTWRDMNDQTVELPEFEATVHADYLRVVDQPG